MLSNDATDELIQEVCDLLGDFQGEESLKRLFWQLLSFDRVREPLPKRLLPPSVIELVDTFEIFAASDSLTVLYATTQQIPAGWQVEAIAAAARRHFLDCLVILRHDSGWHLLYRDETRRPHIRLLALPGPADQLLQSARALISLNAVDESGDPLSSLEQSELLDDFFPGATPNLSDIIDDFERIATHRNPEVRALRPFMRDISVYPLLTASQERGEDIWGNGIPTEEQLRFHQERLVLHNLRLVVWMAFKVNRMEITLGDLVQEGTIGLMTAARRFDLERGNRFTTYAFYWIRQAMYRALHNQCNLIRWPVYVAPKLIEAARAGKADDLGAGQKPVVFLKRPLSMASIPICDFTQAHAIAQIRAAVSDTIAELTTQQVDVILRRFGIGWYEQTLEEIGERYGLTRERIRQIEAKALKRLRHNSRKQRLAPHMECSEWRLTRTLNTVSSVIRFKNGERPEAAPDSSKKTEPRQVGDKQILADGRMQTVRVFESFEDAAARPTGEDEGSCWHEITEHYAEDDDWVDSLPPEPVSDEEIEETRQLFDLWPSPLPQRRSAACVDAASLTRLNRSNTVPRTRNCN